MADIKEMQAKALHELNDAELAQRLEEAKEEQFNLRFQLANGQAENTGRIRTVRRTIARIETVLTEQRRKKA